MVTINGEEKDCVGMTVSQYLERMTYDSRRIAVERNGDIVPKSAYADTVLQDNDVLEVVSFVGGG